MGYEQSLNIKFNCLGVKTMTYFTVTILVTGASPIVIYMGKDCSAETVIDKIDEVFYKEEENIGVFGFLKWLLLFSVMLSVFYFALKMLIGSSVADSMPIPIPKAEAITNSKQNINNSDSDEEIACNYGTRE